jgi:glycolate oxidase FAD binding subunit
MPEGNELRPLVQQLHESASPWVPSGLGNHLHWGAPLQPNAGVVVSLARLKRVLHHAVEDFTITVEAGLPIEELQEVLAQQGQWLPLDAPLAGASSIGAVVARGLSGSLQHRYRHLKDLLLGITLLRSDGTYAKAGGKVVKNVAGYDLMRLFCGSWGSLGLITELTLRTMPLPKARRTVQIKGSLLQLQELRQQLLLKSPLALEFIEWHQGLEPPSLELGLVSLDETELQQQENIISSQLSAGMELIFCGKKSQKYVADDRWLLRLGLKPVQVEALLKAPVSRGWQIQLGAASGIGLAEANLSSMAPYKVEALRRSCQELGGYLVVLQGPSEKPISAWGDVQSKQLIEAIKREFDPLQQLCRGRLPGVAST